MPQNWKCKGQHPAFYIYNTEEVLQRKPNSQITFTSFLVLPGEITYTNSFLSSDSIGEQTYSL